MRQQGIAQRRGWFGVAILAAMFGGPGALLAQFPAPQVTKEHEVLKKDVGVWDAEMTLWMDPSQGSMKTKGMERNRMLGELWLISDFTADLGGQEFRGHGVFGYDAKNKKYVGTWVDTMTTTLSHSDGTYDAEKQEMTMLMTSINPESGKEETAKTVSKYVGPDKRLFTMYMKTAGSDEWVKSMEISYTRRANAGKRKRD